MTSFIVFFTMWSATPYKLPWGHIKHSLGSTCYYNHFEHSKPSKVVNVLTVWKMLGREGRELVVEVR